jgi:hypothetical protein
MSKLITGPGETGPVVVKPKIAWKMLSCSNTRGYELLAAGELESFRDGRSRKITVASIHQYILRQLSCSEPGKNRKSLPGTRSDYNEAEDETCDPPQKITAVLLIKPAPNIASEIINKRTLKPQVHGNQRAALAKSRPQIRTLRIRVAS